MTRDDPSGQPDGSVLRLLPGGLAIVRYRKHDPIDPAAYSKPDLQRRTDKRQGSKFLPAWTIERYVEWLEATVVAAGWRLSPAEPRRLDVRHFEPVGIVRGRSVHTIRVVSDGRTVHNVSDRRFVMCRS